MVQVGCLSASASVTSSSDPVGRSGRVRLRVQMRFSGIQLQRQQFTGSTSSSAH